MLPNTDKENQKIIMKQGVRDRPHRTILKWYSSSSELATISIETMWVLTETVELNSLHADIVCTSAFINAEISTVFYVLSTHLLLWPKVMWKGTYIYSIRQPFTAGLLPQYWERQRQSVSYVCRSLLTVLQQASLFLEICRHMALPDQDHAVFCQ